MPAVAEREHSLKSAPVERKIIPKPQSRRETADASDAHAMLARVAVGAPGGDDVDYPAERPGRPDPGYSRDEQPDNADQYATVIDLPDAGDEKAK